MKKILILLIGANALFTNSFAQITPGIIQHALQKKTVKILQKDRDEQSSPTFKKLGEHILAEFHGCTNLNDYENLASVLQQAAERANATVLTIKTHQFQPQGMTGVAVLQESHISIHTWPEYGYAAVDVFTCGSHVNIEEALLVLESFFQPQTISRVKVDRGFHSTWHKE